MEMASQKMFISFIYWRYKEITSLRCVVPMFFVVV
jgi:hypothetical protein